MPGRRLALTALLATLATARAVHADGATVPSAGEASPDTERRWYGDELLIADGLGAVVFTLGIATQSDAGSVVAMGAVGSLALTPPFLHWRHGNPGRAGASLAMRVGLPLGGAAIASVTCDKNEPSDEWFHCLGPVVGGFAIGALAAIAVDDLVLARDRGASSGSSLQVGVAPSANHGVTFSLGGSF